MMNRVTLGSLTVAESGTESGALDLMSGGRDSPAEFAIYAPATLPEATTVEVSPVGIDGPWVTLQLDGADASVGAGECLVVPHSLALFKAIRVATASVAAERVFTIIAAELLP